MINLTIFILSLRNVLCSDVFLNFLSEKNAIVWAGDISETEAFQGKTYTRRVDCSENGASRY